MLANSAFKVFIYKTALEFIRWAMLVWNNEFWVWIWTEVKWRRGVHGEVDSRVLEQSVWILWSPWQPGRLRLIEVDRGRGSEFTAMHSNVKDIRRLWGCDWPCRWAVGCCSECGVWWAGAVGLMWVDWGLVIIQGAEFWTSWSSQMISVGDQIGGEVAFVKPGGDATMD